MEEPSVPKGEDRYQNILLQALSGGINSTGIVSSENVNSGIELGDQDQQADISKYTMTY